MAKTRIDKLLMDRGLVSSRERARALIMAGKVLAAEVPVLKAGSMVDDAVDIRLKGDDSPYVSRGGIKLEGALADIGIDVSGLTVLDIGASTGGFTDVCLQQGASAVFAVDVGTNQLDYRLRTDPRVLCLEKTNARHLTSAMLPRSADLAVIDVSFISISKILKAVISCLTPDAGVLAMIKPQFEVGRGRVGKGGVVRDPHAREDAVAQVIADASATGLVFAGRADARIKGPKGNQETFVYFKRGAVDACDH